MQWGGGKVYRAMDEWHLWFAWHPVHFDDGRWAWLEWVERRVDVVCGGWDIETHYREYETSGRER